MGEGLPLLLSLGFDTEELGRDEIEAALLTGGRTFGVGLVRVTDPFATSVVPVDLSSSFDAKVARVDALVTGAVRLAGRGGGAVVAIQSS